VDAAERRLRHLPHNCSNAIGGKRRPSYVVRPHKIRHPAFNHRHGAPIHPDVFAQQGRGLADRIIALLRDPIAIEIKKSA